MALITVTGTFTNPNGASVENQDILNPADAAGGIKVFSDGVEQTNSLQIGGGVYYTPPDFEYTSFVGGFQLLDFPSGTTLTFKYGEQNLVGKDAFGGNEIQFQIPDINAQFALPDFQIYFDFEEVYGCTDEYALNYLPEATDDDGSCEYDEVSFDINNDGDSNILDVVQTVEIVLNEPNPSLDNYQMLDLNNDNTINVLDVILMVSFILGRIGL